MTPRRFSPGETLTTEDFRQLLISQAWFASIPGAAEFSEQYEHEPIEPYCRMSREKLFELAVDAGLAEDWKLWHVLTEHLRDQMTTEELARETAVFAHVQGILDSRTPVEGQTAIDHAQLIANSFDFIGLVEGKGGEE